MMATSTLMSESCKDDYCDEEAEYLVSFCVKSLEMNDSEDPQDFDDVLIVITWDGNVVKLLNNNPEAESFDQRMDLVIRSTASLISKKLKSSPIMFNLSRGCTELGTFKLEVSNCFADAVLCNEFSSQTVTNEFNFITDDDDEINASMTAFFRIQKMLDEGVGQQTFNKNAQLKKKKKDSSRKLKKASSKNSNKSQSAKKDDSTDDDDELGTNSNADDCDDSACLDEMSNRFKRDLDLHKNIYRIINGHLINTKDQIGPCGTRCLVAEKYSKELTKEKKSRVEFNNGFSKCSELFEPSADSSQASSNCQTCRSCGGKVQETQTSGKVNEQSEKPCKENWIDRNIQEEDLLKKLCEKYEIDIEDIRNSGKMSVQVKPKGEKKKGRKIKKTKGRKPKKIASPCDPSLFTEPTRKEFIRLMKRKACGKYSYNFGNSYPLHRGCSNVEQGDGDASTILPRNIGWRWDKPILGIGNKKWFPGMINKKVHCLMKNTLKSFPHDKIPLTRRDDNGRVIKTCNDLPRLPKFYPELIQRPALHILKRNGEFLITMNPLKSRDKLETDCDPFMSCSPLKFKIKKHPEEIKKHCAKEHLRELGLFKKCSCLNINCCRCISETAKKLMAYELKQISDQLKLEKELAFNDLSESSESELDLEFTTPSAHIKKQNWKPDVVHLGTQCEVKDFILPKIKNDSKLQKNEPKTFDEKKKNISSLVGQKKKSSLTNKNKKLEQIEQKKDLKIVDQKPKSKLDAQKKNLIKDVKMKTNKNLKLKPK